MLAAAPAASPRPVGWFSLVNVEMLTTVLMHVKEEKDFFILWFRVIHSCDCSPP